MAKGYMPQEVFDAGAAVIARIRLSLGTPMEVSAGKIASRYQGTYVDDGYEAAWISAASQGVAELKELKVPDPVALLTAFVDHAMNYMADGTPRQKRLFGGTWFAKPCPQNLAREADFLKRLEKYYLHFPEPIRASLFADRTTELPNWRDPYGET